MTVTALLVSLLTFSAANCLELARELCPSNPDGLPPVGPLDRRVICLEHDAVGRRTDYQYDELNRRVRMRYPPSSS
jgi:hypothetical protein